MVVTEFPAPRSIVDIIDAGIAQRNSQRSDAVGKLVSVVLAAADPDAVLQDLVRSVLTGFPSATRKKKITMLAVAFGADRREFKKYLRGRGLCGPMD